MATDTHRHFFNGYKRDQNSVSVVAPSYNPIISNANIPIIWRFAFIELCIYQFGQVFSDMNPQPLWIYPILVFVISFLHIFFFLKLTHNKVPLIQHTIPSLHFSISSIPFGLQMQFSQSAAQNFIINRHIQVGISLLKRFKYLYLSFTAQSPALILLIFLLNTSLYKLQHLLRSFLSPAYRILYHKGTRVRCYLP